MAQGIIIGDRRIKPRFYLFVALILAIILYIIKLTSKTPVFETIQYGEIISWNQCTGLVIRQETTLTTPDYGKVDFFESNGQMVEKDTLLAIIYKDNFNRDLIEQLYNVKHKIAEHQNKNIVNEILDGDFQKIHEDIEDTLRTMQYNVYHEHHQDMERLENHLRGLLNRRKEILDKGSSPNNYLEGLLQEEKELETKLDEWKVEIIAPESGLVSFEIDGLEKIVTPDCIDYLTPEQYLSFREHNVVDSKGVEPMIDVPLFKIVAPDKWYMASLIEHRDVFYEQGDSVKVNILGFSDSVIDGTIYRVDYLKDSTFLIVEFGENIDKILGARNIQVEIGTSTQGLMVPRDAIIDKKGKTLVKVSRNGDIQYIEVRIQAMDDKWVIIDKVKDEDFLDLNDTILFKQ